jgi:hypothetical protein
MGVLETGISSRTLRAWANIGGGWDGWEYSDDHNI